MTNPDPLRADAYHEAGHAVAAVVLGTGLVSVDIRPQTAPSGGIGCAGTDFNWSPDTEISGRGEEAVMPYLVTLFAGLFAEKRIDPAAGMESGQPESDGQMVARYAIAAVCTPVNDGGKTTFAAAEVAEKKRRIAAFLDAAQERTEKFVKRYGQAIDAVAARLLAEEVLTASDVNEIVAANAPADGWQASRAGKKAKTPPTIQLPTAGMFSGAEVTDCEWRLRTFVERDAYVTYDWAGSYAQPPGDVIQDSHVSATNSAMRARSPRKAWANFVGTALPDLAAIPHNLDLIDSPTDHVERALESLDRLTGRITAVKGLTEMAVSKVLYLLRPNFVAISDSYVRDALGIRRGRPADTMVRVARAVRELGLRHSNALQQLHIHANGLPPVVPVTGRYRGQSIPIRLSKARILDIVIWTEGALHGPTPNQQWLKWHGKARTKD